MSKKIELGIHETMCFLKNLTDAQSISQLMLKQLIKKDYQLTELYHLIRSVAKTLDAIENRVTPCLILNDLTSSQVERPVDENLDTFPWDETETKLIIDPMFDGYQFALVNHDNKLVARGKADSSLSVLISFLCVKNEHVYVDFGGENTPEIIKLCAENGYTVIKGTSSGVIKKMHLDGCEGYLINPKEPPFCFLD